MESGFYSEETLLSLLNIDWMTWIAQLWMKKITNENSQCNLEKNKLLGWALGHVCAPTSWHVLANYRWIAAKQIHILKESVVVVTLVLCVELEIVMTPGWDSNPRPLALWPAPLTTRPSAHVCLHVEITFVVGAGERASYFLVLVGAHACPSSCDIWSL